MVCSSKSRDDRRSVDRWVTKLSLNRDERKMRKLNDISVSTTYEIQQLKQTRPLVLLPPFGRRTMCLCHLFWISIIQRLSEMRQAIARKYLWLRKVMSRSARFHFKTNTNIRVCGKWKKYKYIYIFNGALILFLRVGNEKRLTKECTIEKSSNKNANNF